jgi:hypothetical protein
MFSSYAIAGFLIAAVIFIAASVHSLRSNAADQYQTALQESLKLKTL